MSLNAGLSLGFLFTATDNASHVMAGLGNQFTRLDSTSKSSATRVQASMGAMTVGLGSLAAGAKLAGTAFDSAMSAGTFEQDLYRVRNIMNATDAEMQAIRERSVQAGMETQYSPHEALAGVKELGTLGFTAAEGINALTGSLDFAAAGNLSVAQASMTTGAALRIFGKDASEAAESADKLLKISTLTAMQAGDLQLALGSVSRGASVTKQGLDDMLIAMGLVKNTGVDASVAGQSVSSAMIMVAKNAKLFKDIGVDVTKADGSFRSFLDVALDTGDAMNKLSSEPEKVEKMYKLFSKFGLTAVSAIGTQLTKGIKTASGEIVQGGDALTYLRQTMDNAAGTAKKFKEETLDTLPGQLTLIEGLVQTLKMEAGVAVADVLKPMAETARGMLEWMISSFKDLSPPVKKAVGLITLVAGGLLAGGGAFIAFAGALSMAMPMITAMGAGIASFLPAIAPVLLAVGALAGAFYLLREAYQKNIGGFADTMRPLFEKVQLFFVGLYQLITDGFLSGDTATKIQDPQHSGLLQFMIVLYKWGYRAKVFVEELADSVSRFIEDMRTPFEELGSTIDKVRDLVANLTGDVDGLTPPMDDVASAADTVGTVIGLAFHAVVSAVTIAGSILVGFVAELRNIYKVAKPYLAPLLDAFDGLMEAFEKLFAEFTNLDGSMGASSDGWASFGAIVADVTAVAIYPLLIGLGLITDAARVVVVAITGAVKIIKSILGSINDVVDGVKALAEGDWETAWKKFGAVFERIWGAIKESIGGVVDEIMSIINDLLTYLSEVIMAIPEKFRPDFLTDMAKSIGTAVDAPAAGAVDIGYDAVEAASDEQLQWGDYMRDAQLYGNSVEGPESKARGSDPAKQLTQEQMTSAFTVALKAVGLGGTSNTLRASFNVDGQQMAEVVAEAQKSNNALAYGSDTAGE